MSHRRPYSSKLSKKGKKKKKKDPTRYYPRGDRGKEIKRWRCRPAMDWGMNGKKEKHFPPANPKGGAHYMSHGPLVKGTFEKKGGEGTRTLAETKKKREKKKEKKRG